MQIDDMTREDYRFRPIGIIHSGHTDPARTPVQPVFAPGEPGRVEVMPEYADGLADLEGFSHVHLFYVFHRSQGPRLRLKPFLQDIEHGIFATRAPRRPNPIGMSLVRLVRCEGNVLHIEDVDILDGAPLLDIKPFVPRFDLREGARAGWQDEVENDKAWRLGRRDFESEEETCV